MVSKERLKELLAEALPFIEGADLVGTGCSPCQEEINDVNELMTEIIEVLDLDPDNFGFHSEAG